MAIALGEHLNLDSKYEVELYQIRSTNWICARGQFGMAFMLGYLDRTAKPARNGSVSTSKSGMNNITIKHSNVSMHEETRVCVKSVDEHQHHNHFRALVTELNTLSSIPSHENILNLKGSCTKQILDRKLTLAFDFCPNGNLLHLLRRSRVNFKNLFQKNVLPTCIQGEGVKLDLMNVWNLYKWSLDIASGMAFLAQHKVVHGDLASRNLLITSNYNIKISCFCLSRKLKAGVTIYHHTFPKVTLPLKWMAPESIKQPTFSLQSDIWSFGVVMWEIFTLGLVPYSHFEDMNRSWILILDGFRLEKPDYAPEHIYMLMLHCWDLDPKTRPSFHSINQKLQHGMDKYENVVVQYRNNKQ